MEIPMNRLKYPLALVILIASVHPIIAQQRIIDGVRISQIFRPIAEVTDKVMIEMFLSDYFIAEDAANVTKIELLDVTSNGWGPDDIMIVYPSLTVYTIEQPSPRIQSMMSQWFFDDKQVDAVNQEADNFYPFDEIPEEQNNLPLDRQIEVAQNAILSDLIGTLSRNYHTMPISMRFERDIDGFTFQIWDYDPYAFSFNSRPRGENDTIPIFDLMYIHVIDSTIKADTVMYDILYIDTRIEEIHYIPEVLSTGNASTRRQVRFSDARKED
jgi:hypothetical protein